MRRTVVLIAALSGCVQVVQAQEQPKLHFEETAEYLVVASTAAELSNAKSMAKAATDVFRSRFGSVPRAALVFESTAEIPAMRAFVDSLEHAGVPMYKRRIRVITSGDAGGTDPARQRMLDRMRAMGTTPAFVQHEFCHVLFVAWVDSVSHSRKLNNVENADRYGHPLMPDWLDEAAAVSCEPPADLQKRRQIRVADVPPLDSLLGMKHPSSASVASALFSAPADAQAGNQVKSAAARLGASGGTQGFYTASMLWSDFITEKAGAHALGIMVEAALAGESPAGMLKRLGFPANVAAVNEQWRAYLADHLPAK